MKTKIFIYISHLETSHLTDRATLGSVYNFLKNKKLYKYYIPLAGSNKCFSSGTYHPEPSLMYSELFIFLMFATCY